MQNTSDWLKTLILFIKDDCGAMQPLKTCHSVACQCQPFYSVLHTKSISPFRCFVFCFFCALNTSCGKLRDLCSALTLPGILPNTISNLWKTSTVIQIPKRPPPTALNHYRAVALTSVVMKCLERILLNIIALFVTTNTDTLQFVYNARSYSKYGGIPAAPSPSALGFTWQLYQASLCWFQFRIQHHPETQNLNITPIWSTSSKTPSAGQQKKWEWTQPHHLYPKLELCRDACWALTHISFILMAYQLPSHTFNMRTT